MWDTLLNSLPTNLAVIDETGAVRFLNRAWRAFARDNGGLLAEHDGVGEDYITLCQRSLGLESVDAARLREGIDQVASGQHPQHDQEYPCHGLNRTHWLAVRVTPVAEISATESPNRRPLLVTHEDITARKQAELEREVALREQEVARQQMRQVMEQANCILWQAEVREFYPANPQNERYMSFDPERGTRLNWNLQVMNEAEVLRWLPLNRREGERFSTTWNRARHPGDFRETTERCRVALLSGADRYVQTFRTFAADGSVRWLQEDVRVRAVPPEEVVAEEFSEGKYTRRHWRLTGVVTEVTERKLAEERQRALAEDLRHMMASARCLLWSAEVARTTDDKWFGGMEWKFLYYDEEMAQRFLPLNSAPGESYPAAIVHNTHPADRLRMDAYGVEKIQRGEDYSQEFRVRGVHGRWHWLAEVVHVESIEPDRWRVVGVITDVTERKQAEEQLKDSEERFRSAIASMQEGVVLQNDRGEIVLCNAAAERILGRRREEIQGAVVANLEWGTQRGDGSPWAKEDYPSQIALREGRIVHGELMGFRRPDGALAWILANAAPLFHPGEDRPYGTVVTFADVTEMRALTEALQKSNDSLQTMAAELRRSNAALQEFAYVASHDLKEPLRKIQSFGGMLQRKAGATLSLEAQDYVDRMCAASVRMQTLIEGLLAYSRVSSRPPQVTAVDLNEVVAGVLSDLEARIFQTEAKVVVQPLPTVVADALQMRQLLQNLIGNALKFRRAGVPLRVTISSPTPQEPEEPGWATLQVADNGIGFAPEHAERIFGIFERLVDKEQGYEGTGIGLAICKKIVERYGGSIRATGMPGEGATFAVRLPTIRPEDISGAM